MSVGYACSRSQNCDPLVSLEQVVLSALQAKSYPLARPCSVANAACTTPQRYSQHVSLRYLCYLFAVDHCTFVCGALKMAIIALYLTDGIHSL